MFQKSKAKVTEALQIIDAERFAYADNTSKATWTSTEAVHGWTDYVSKVKDYTWTVTFDSATDTYSIKGHDAAKLINKDYTDETVVTEDQLAAKTQ